jgi:hypothetical protein
MEGVGPVTEASTGERKPSWTEFKPECSLEPTLAMTAVPTSLAIALKSVSIPMVHSRLKYLLAVADV